jgi:hypothetical protein
MPRSKPFTCHTCGTQYLGARCHKCYPPKKKRSSSSSRGRRRSGGGRSRKAQINWGRVLAPPGVNTDAVPERKEEEDDDAK